MSSVESEQETKAIEDLSFEEALALLDETVDALESGSLTLAQSMAMYERGMKLARVCNEMLTSAEMRITRIRTAYGEQMRMVDSDDDMEVGS
ncbi:Exodeoxyribonuclease 7 small subunit [Geodia barretti]|jgi:exodeoxyribonuclease VII small subunit|uniref:Exodeoxyribonuclease 7 small subunit n=1 Tax=Geodia barretti TaxID=519541 RepID=A0AA35WGL1_GEOBA|nr:Exodeoxyribonuclease 7 small subunit [Geodia barretti]